MKYHLIIQKQIPKPQHEESTAKMWQYRSSMKTISSKYIVLMFNVSRLLKWFIQFHIPWTTHNISDHRKRNFGVQVIFDLTNWIDYSTIWYKNKELRGILKEYVWNIHVHSVCMTIVWNVYNGVDDFMWYIWQVSLHKLRVTAEWLDGRQLWSGGEQDTII